MTCGRPLGARYITHPAYGRERRFRAADCPRSAAARKKRTSRMLTFRTSITFAVMAFIVALTALLIAIQARSLSLAMREAASAYMDAASSKVFGRLQVEMAAIASSVQVLATSSSVTGSDDVTETSPALPLLKTALTELPLMDRHLRRVRKRLLVASAAVARAQCRAAGEVARVAPARCLRC